MAKPPSALDTAPRQGINDSRSLRAGGPSFPEAKGGDVQADEITVSAPNHRVDLEALKRPKLGGRSRAMMIIGCDLHTRYQQIAMVGTETGEFVQRRLEHESEEARGFYAGLKGAVRVGIEATGPGAPSFSRSLRKGWRDGDHRCTL